jgi:hypothetical protein
MFSPNTGFEMLLLFIIIIFIANKTLAGKAIHTEYYMSKSVSRAVSTLDLYHPRAGGPRGDIGFSG